MTCFWTALLRAEQECGGGGDNIVAFINPYGDGFSWGCFRLRYMQSGDIADELCFSEELYLALTAATTVTITGLLFTEDDLSAMGGADFPAITFDDVSLAMTLDEFGSSYAEYTYATPNDMADGWYWVRVDVDGVIYQGALYNGSGV